MGVAKLQVRKLPIIPKGRRLANPEFGFTLIHQGGC